MQYPRTYLYGTHYFRPPNPPRDQHRFHLKQIKQELGFDLIKLRMQWNAIHRDPGHFQWDEYDQIADICGELDLAFLLEINMETSPYWLERACPEARYVSANGQAIELGPYDSTPYGGFPGLCFHHGPVQQHGREYLVALVNHFAGRQELLGYDCWNEPHLEPAWIGNYWGNMGDRLFCYCEETKKTFRHWLTDKYQQVETLNQTWGRAYGQWNDIQPPNRHGHYADWLDWGRFWYDQLHDHMKWRYEAIKEYDPSRFVKSHSGAVPPFLSRPNAFIHNWRLAEPVDMWGCSFSPAKHNWDLSNCAGTLDATRSAAQGKPFWVTEMSGGSWDLQRGWAKTPAPTDREYRTWNWLSALYGAKATCHWCYLEEVTGPEAGKFGLVRANGDITPRARAAAEACDAMHRFSPMLMDYQPQPQVGILYDPDNTMQQFAMMAGDEHHVESHTNFYRAVWNSDNFARYVTYDTLDDLAGLRILLAPMCLTLPESAAEKIAQFVRNGGVLLADARAGLFDHRGYIRGNLPAGALAQVVGAIEEESIYSDPENRPLLNNPGADPYPDPVLSGPPIEVSEPICTTFRAHGFLVPLKPTTGTPIAKCGQWCLGVTNQFGQGTAYYIGTYLGLARGPCRDAVNSLIVSILDRHTQPVVRGQRLRPRYLQGDGESLLAVFNLDRNETYSETIALPQSFSSAINVYNGQTIEIKNQSLGLTVDPEDVCVVHLR